MFVARWVVVANMTETSVRRYIMMLFGVSACGLWINIVLWEDFNFDMIVLGYCYIITGIGKRHVLTPLASSKYVVRIKSREIDHPNVKSGVIRT